MDSLGIGVIGLGDRLGAVLPHLLAADPRFRLLGYADPHPEGGRKLAAARVDGGTAFDDAETMIAALKPDLVMIGSPNHLHLAHLRIALAMAPKVFIEKPLVRTVEESWAAAELIREAGASRVLVGLVLRSMPLVRRVRDLVQSGRLGRISGFEANEHLSARHGGYLMRNWRRRQDYAGSYLLDKCCHDFDLFAWIMGARAIRVSSLSAQAVFRQDNPDLSRTPIYSDWASGWGGIDDFAAANIDVADAQHALLRYDNGAMLNFASNTNSGMPQRSWLIHGTSASLHVDLHRGQIRIGDPTEAAAVERIDLELGDPSTHYGADIALAHDLAAHLLGGAAFQVDPYDAIAAGLTVMAIDQAAASGETVDLLQWWQRLDASVSPTAACPG